MSEQENRAHPNANDPNAEHRGALTDLTIAVAGAGAYDALKTGAKQLKGKLDGGDKSKD